MLINKRKEYLNIYFHTYILIQKQLKKTCLLRRKLKKTANRQVEFFFRNSILPGPLI